MVKYRFSLKVKDCNTVFADGFLPGVLVVQEIVFDDANESDVGRPMFQKALMEAMDDFVKQHIQVDIVDSTSL